MRFLLYLSKKYSIPIVEPIIKYIGNTEHSIGLFLSEKVLESIPENWKKITTIQDVSKAISFDPDFVLVPGNFVDYRIPGMKVQLFHGLGIEKASHYKIRHFFDVYCTSGPYVTEKFNKIQHRHNYFLVKETGWPKVDHIINFDSKDINKRFSVPADKKIILYAPTHSKKMQSAEALIPHIPSFIKDDEHWIVKYHELMGNDIKKIRNHPSITIVNDYDITPYLHVADVLISDTSSVLYEFMILDKPVITYQTTGRKDKGIDIQEPCKLPEAIRRSLQHPDEFSENRKKHIAEINPYCDGKISERLIETLIRVKINNELPHKKKPLNLFRKMQIHYHERYKKGYLR